MLMNQNNSPEITPNIQPLEKKTPGLKKSIKSETTKNYFSRLDFSEQNDFSGGSQKRKGLKLALWTWASAAVDHLMIFGTSCLFLLIGTFVLQKSAQIAVTYQMLGSSAAVIYFVISISYFVLFRIFLGATMGEYSCGLRLGQPTERMNKTYSARIIIRTLYITATGIVILPLLSVLFKKDIAGQFSGVSIYSLK